MQFLFKICGFVFSKNHYLSSHKMMAWWIRPWNVVEKVVGSNLTLNIHHYKKNLEFGDSITCTASTNNLLVMLA
jgi:hypothetical protein